MVVFEHDHAGEVVSMGINAANKHSILLYQPET